MGKRIKFRKNTFLNVNRYGYENGDSIDMVKEVFELCKEHNMIHRFFCGSGDDTVRRYLCNTYSTNNLSSNLDIDMRSKLVDALTDMVRDYINDAEEEVDIYIDDIMLWDMGNNIVGTEFTYSDDTREPKVLSARFDIKSGKAIKKFYESCHSELLQNVFYGIQDVLSGLSAIRDFPVDLVEFTNMDVASTDYESREAWCNFNIKITGLSVISDYNGFDTSEVKGKVALLIVN